MIEPSILLNCASCTHSEQYFSSGPTSQENNSKQLWQLHTAVRGVLHNTCGMPDTCTATSHCLGQLIRAPARGSARCLTPVQLPPCLCQLSAKVLQGLDGASIQQPCYCLAPAHHAHQQSSTALRQAMSVSVCLHTQFIDPSNRILSCECLTSHTNAVSLLLARPHTPARSSHYGM